jgi:hypothetical protein
MHKRYSHLHLLSSQCSLVRTVLVQHDLLDRSPARRTNLSRPRSSNRRTVHPFRVRAMRRVLLRPGLERTQTGFQANVPCEATRGFTAQLCGTRREGNRRTTPTKAGGSRITPTHVVGSREISDDRTQAFVVSVNTVYFSYGELVTASYGNIYSSRPQPRV